MSKRTITKLARTFEVEQKTTMVPDGAEMIDGKFVTKEREQVTNVITSQNRLKRIPAQHPVEVGECGICYQPVFQSPGQLIKKGKYGISHKACRGRGKNKTKGYG